MLHTFDVYEMIDVIVYLIALASTLGLWVYYSLFKRAKADGMTYLQAYRDYASKAHRLEQQMRRMKATNQRLEAQLFNKAEEESKNEQSQM